MSRTVKAFIDGLPLIAPIFGVCVVHDLPMPPETQAKKNIENKINALDQISAIASAAIAKIHGVIDSEGPSQITKNAIDRLTREGYTQTDILAVIACKKADWGSDHEKKKYLTASYLLDTKRFHYFLDDARTRGFLQRIKKTSEETNRKIKEADSNEIINARVHFQRSREIASELSKKHSMPYIKAVGIAYKILAAEEIGAPLDQNGISSLIESAMPAPCAGISAPEKPSESSATDAA